MGKSMNEHNCLVCGKPRKRADLIPASIVRSPIADLIQETTGSWDPDGFICEDDYNNFRYLYVQKLLEKERGDLSELDREVLDSLSRHELLSSSENEEFESDLTFGQRLSDRMAAFGGSWTFIISFGAILLLWIMVNTVVLMKRPFDPYPFILLNLVLSCLAALQAPVIMMSQNRQEAKDRLRAANDYQINLKAELEIRHLHQKMDHLLNQQWDRMSEIQEIQMDLLEELRLARGGKGPAKRNE